MALKAGRVGVRPDQVDAQGRIIGGGGGGDSSKIIRGSNVPDVKIGNDGDIFLLMSAPLIPVLTANDSNVIAGQNLNDAFRAYDNDKSTFWTTADRVFTNMYIGYMMENPKAVNHIAIMPRQFNNIVQLHTFKVQGLVNNTWVDVYEGEIPNQVEYAGIWNHFYFENETEYDGYRILATDINSSATFTIFGLQFYAYGSVIDQAYIKDNNQWVSLIGADLTPIRPEVKVFIGKKEVKQ